MAETYSLGKVGRGTNHGPANNTNPLTLADSAARDGNIIGNAQTGAQILCKRADGSFGWYVVNAERSTLQVPVMRPI